MDKYKKVIYDNYIKNHNENLYGKATTAKMDAVAKVLDFYYGRHLLEDKNINILDIGCGNGNLVYWLNSLGYKNVKGIDVSQQQIDQGTSFGIKNLECIDLFTFLNQNTIKFDIIIAKDVIEHFTRDEVFDILSLVYNNLNEKGRFMMQVPNGEGLFYTSIFYGDYTHEMAYTASSVNQVALNTGFSKSKCFPVAPPPLGIKSRVRSLLWSLIVFKLKFSKMVATGSSSGIFTPNLIAVIGK